MTTMESLRKQATELHAEVKSALEDTSMTAAQKAEKLDALEAKNADIATAVKNHQRASSILSASDLGDPGQTKSPMVEAQEKAYADEEAYQKGLAERFESMKSAAKGRNRGDFKFELKTQGGTGVQGVGASGTTAGTAPSNGTYFYGGPAGTSIAPQFIPGISELRFYPNVMNTLFSSMPVDSPIVTWVREASWTNNAAPVPEGATKPTSTNGVSRFQETIGKIANLAHVTDELIQDAPYFWSLIQRRLPQGVSRVEDVQLLAGTGYPGVNGLLSHTAGFTQHTASLTAVTNVNIPSVAGGGVAQETVSSVTPGLQIVGASSGAYPTGVALAEGILQAMTDLRTRIFNPFEPDAILVNPADWQIIRLAKDSAGQYLGGSFFGTNYGNAQDAGVVSGPVDTSLSLWGKTVISTPILPAGLCIVGAFREAAQILRKGGLDVQLTNTNGTDFEQNLWTVRAEERVGLMVEYPEAFELVQFAAHS